MSNDNVCHLGSWNGHRSNKEWNAVCFVKEFGMFKNQSGI